MRNFKSSVVAAIALLTFFFMAPAKLAHAQFPAYLHALSDLKTARGYLQMAVKPEAQDACKHAVKEISHAIDDMSKAAVDDGKNTELMPRPQGGGGNANWPIHSAVKLLKEARTDVENGHDRPENKGLREHSLEHIDKAILALTPFL
jgi:predicted nucleotide-binding protein (sugar kinase/HSP70/actin superfamily)